jgi:hypothetical protein
MTNIFHFDSRVQLGNRSSSYWPQDAVKNEPMLFNCSFARGYDLGGPITRDFLDLLPYQWENSIIDSRVHMLMPGWFPCIPGWHHDDVPRSRTDGQPNYMDPEYRAEHAMFLVNGEIAPTQFALGRVDMEEPPLGAKIYEKWSKQIHAFTSEGTLKSWSAPSNQVIYFDWQTFHNGVSAIKPGWRFFIRASRNTNRKPTNEVRKQVQVYLNALEEGW